MGGNDDSLYSSGLFGSEIDADENSESHAGTTYESVQYIQVSINVIY